jgi:hypothetical protein
MATIHYSCIYPTGYTLSIEEQAKYNSNSRYTSISDWDNDQDRDLVSLDEIEICEIIWGDETSNWLTVGFDGQLVFYNWICDADHYIFIRAIGEARCNGIFSDGLYTIYGNEIYAAIRVQNTGALYVRLDGIQCQFVTTTSSRSLFYSSGSDYEVFEFSNCFLKVDNNNYNSGAITVGTESNKTIRIWNCIIDGNGMIGVYIRSTIGGTVNIYHSLITKMGYGIADYPEDTVENVKNCVLFNNTDDFFFVDSITNCASDDGEGDNAILLNENASGEWEACFVDYANGNYKVKDKSSLLYNAGVDLTNEFTTIDGETNPLKYDILGNERTTWDVGPFAYVSTGIQILRRRREGY